MYRSGANADAGGLGWPVSDPGAVRPLLDDGFGAAGGLPEGGNGELEGILAPTGPSNSRIRCSRRGRSCTYVLMTASRSKASGAVGSFILHFTKLLARRLSLREKRGAGYENDQSTGRLSRIHFIPTEAAFLVPTWMTTRIFRSVAFAVAFYDLVENAAVSPPRKDRVRPV